jgi:ABC-type spermidine/putrescine transport system permease subunit I
MNLPTWLSILLYALIVYVGGQGVWRILKWRGLTKEQIQWAIFVVVVFMIIIYIATRVLVTGR